MTRGRVLTAVTLIVLAFVWGTQYLVVRLSQSDLPPWRAVALRFTVVALLGQVALLLRPSPAPPGALWPRAAMGATQALSMGLLYAGQARLPSALVSVLMTTTPLFVVVIAARWLAEPVRARTVVGSVLGILGVVILTGSEWSVGEDEGAALVGIALVLAAALSSAVSKTVGKTIADLPVALLLRDLGAVVAIVAASVSLATEDGVRWAVDPVALGGALYLGAVASTIANALYFVMLRDAEVSRLSYLQVVSATVGLVSGILVADERLAPGAVVGIGIVLVGAALHASHVDTEARAAAGGESRASG